MEYNWMSKLHILWSLLEGITEQICVIPSLQIEIVVC